MIKTSPITTDKNCLKLFAPSKGRGDKEFFLDSQFIEWLSGFTDAEGNFNITLRKLNDPLKAKANNYSSAMLTFQIGLHIDDLPVLEKIKNKLNCGRISISGFKCNYFVNDIASLTQIIVPIFKFGAPAVNLNSSKYFQFLIFEEAVNLFKNKKHLTPEGRIKLLNLYFKMKEPYLAPSSKDFKLYGTPPMTSYWLGGFTDGDSTFSIGNYKPRLKFENHEKEIELFKRIKTFLNSNSKVITSKPRKNRALSSNPTVCLDITEIHFLKKTIVPLYSSGILLSKKLKDFNDWCIVVELYYLGYHLLPQGKSLINEIKSRWNNFRLSSKTRISEPSLAQAREGQRESNTSFDLRLNSLFLIPSPYEIKNGIRFKRGTNNLISESLKIIATDNLNNRSLFSSIAECSTTLKLDRAKIKNSLLSGEEYQNYKFSWG